MDQTLLILGTLINRIKAHKIINVLDITKASNCE